MGWLKNNLKIVSSPCVFLLILIILLSLKNPSDASGIFLTDFKSSGKVFLLMNSISVKLSYFSLFLEIHFLARG